LSNFDFMLSFTEENYLKALLKITFEADLTEAGTNELASALSVKPATANDMLKKLKEKKLVVYEKYGKITLTASGLKAATEITRKHRLWETFLFEKLGFSWDEVHEVAEQLEHIQSSKLINKLDEFLDFPKFDPHGDYIPSANGEIKIFFTKTLASLQAGNNCKMAAVKDNSTSFLQYVASVGLKIGDKIKIIAKHEYDALMLIQIGTKKVSVSQKFAENILVVCNNCVIGKSCSKNKCEL
jgi:DtxR family Mn-dependent transcriptional regulator